MKKIKSVIICLMHIMLVSQVIQGHTFVDPTVWKFKTSGAVYATPLIHNDTIFIGSLDSCFYAINATTGEQFWKYKTKSQINTTASIYRNIISFGSGNYLYGFDVNGKLLWEFKMYEAPAIISNDPYDYFNSSPKLVDSIAYIGTEKGLIYGVNVKNGQQVFKYQTPDEKFTVETTPVIYEGKIFYGTYGGQFCAIDLKTSKEVWRFESILDFIPNLTNAIEYDGKICFEGRYGYFYCLNANTGAVIWRYNDPTLQWITGLTIKDSTFYMGSSDQHIVRSVNANTGKQNWIAFVDYVSYGSPCADTNYIFFGTGDYLTENNGSLFAIDKNTGLKKTKFNANGRVQSSPILYKDKLYFGCGNGYIYAIDKQKFINVSFPKIEIKNKQLLNFGKKSSDISFDTVIYISNIGVAIDSITLTCDKKEVSFSPTWSIVKPGDSVKVKILVNPIGLSAKRYGAIVSVKSNYSIFQEIVKKAINYEVYITVSNKALTNNDNELQIYPNPLSAKGSIKYRLTKNSNINLSIYDGLGKEVLFVEKGFKYEGVHMVTFNCNTLPQGIYFCKLNTGADNFTQKLL